MTEELKPCPACGSKAGDPHVFYTDGCKQETAFTRWAIGCVNSDCRFMATAIGHGEIGRNRVIAYWNRRPLETVSLSTDERSYTIVLPKPEEQVVKAVVQEVLKQKEEDLARKLSTNEEIWKRPSPIRVKNVSGIVVGDPGGSDYIVRVPKSEVDAQLKPDPICKNCNFWGGNRSEKTGTSPGECNSPGNPNAFSIGADSCEYFEQFKPKPSPRCGNCRFGVLCGSRPNVHRQCQKCSPYVNKDGASKWPHVGDHDWCGDHEYKED